MGSFTNNVKRCDILSKIKPLDRTLVKPASFHNQRSYNAALFAVDVINNIIEKHNTGYIILNYEKLIKPEFGMYLGKNGECTAIWFRNSTHSVTCFVGDVHDGVTDLIYCTKRDIKEYFALWRVCKITSSARATDLTKTL